MILGHFAAVPIVSTAQHLLANIPVIFKDEKNLEGKVRYNSFKRGGSAYAYPYHKKPLFIKVTGCFIETLIHFVSQYLLFSIDLAGRAQFLKNAHPLIQVGVAICQPIAQYSIGLATSLYVREAFRTYFIYPKSW